MFAALFAAGLVICSMGTGKLYPFEPPSFFVAAAHTYAQYRVTDPSGKPLPLHELGIGNFYAGQAGYAIGAPQQEAAAIRLPATNVVFGEVRTRDEITTAVQRALRARGGPDYVVVSQRVIGQSREHPETIDVLADDEWQVQR